MSRKIQDYLADISLNLILIADKPLNRDSKKIFDSPLGEEYLYKCFKAGFADSQHTHVTFVNEGEDDTEVFARGHLIENISKYNVLGKLNVDKLAIGFVGKAAFEAIKKDVHEDSYDKDDFTCYIDEQNKIIRLGLFGNRTRDRITIPYYILPAVDQVDSVQNEMLNLSKHHEEIHECLKKSDEKFETKYHPIKEVTTKLQGILDAISSKEIDSFKFTGNFNQDSAVFYCKIYDEYTHNELEYDSSQCVAKGDTKEDKASFIKKLRESLSAAKVITDDVEKTKNVLLSLHIGKELVDSAQVLTEEQYKKINKVLKPSFKVYDMVENKCLFDSNSEDNVFKPEEAYNKGTRSEWYEKYKKQIMSSGNKLERDKHAGIRLYEWIYDIEVFKNDFLLVAYSLDKRYKVVCWNDYAILNTWLKNKIMIGFNNSAYDDNVVKFAISKYNCLEKAKSLSEEDYKSEKIKYPSIKVYSDKLINDEKVSYPDLFSFLPDFISWDISFHLPFNTRRNSLKKLTMSVLNRRNYDTSVSFEIDRPLTQEERDDVEKYCAMDVDNTLSLYLPDPKDVEELKNNPKHKCREYAQQSYDVRWNMIIRYKMGIKTLINKDASFAGKVLCGENTKPNKKNTYKEVDGKKQYYAIPELAEKELANTEILDFYKKHQSDPDYITKNVQTDINGKICDEKSTVDEGERYQFGFGGLHQALLNYGSKNLVNMDVASLYPSLLIQYNLMSRGAANPASYKEVYDTRIKAKHDGDTLLNLGLKQVLNGAIGAMLSDFNPLYDTWSNSTICVYGQLLVFILARRLNAAGLKIVQTNTDGIMIETKEGVDHMAIAEQWMKETRLVLEFDEIAILQQNNVNNYYCKFSNGKVKSKGFYLSNEKFGKATSKILCNIVTDAPLYEGVDPRDYVIFKRHAVSEIYDAETRTKVDGRSLAFVVGLDDDPETRAYYSRSKNSRETAVKDEKGHKIQRTDKNGNLVFDKDGKPVYLMETINTESKITGFTDHMLLIDDMDSIDESKINKQAYVAFAKNLLNKKEVFGPYYNENYAKVEEPDVYQALNCFKDNSISHPIKSNLYCQNFLFECDYLSKEEQEEIIERIKDKLYRVVWSGNRSYHMIIRLDKPVTSTNYVTIWRYLKQQLNIMDADEAGVGPTKYTRVPGQVNPKTGEMQTLYLEDKNELNTQEILDNLPRLKDVIKPYKEYKGTRSIEALEKQIKKLDWTEGNRFSSVQKLSPALVSLVPLDELEKMIPCKLDKDHRYVLRCKYRTYEICEANKEN